MDFFQAQEDARRRTGHLIFLFGAAVFTIIVAVYIILAIGLGAGLGAGPMGFDPVFFAVVAVGTMGLIAGGSGVRMAQLRKGGPAVAELLGARAVDRATKDPAERRLVNVVEEMSVASGTPVPAIYVMDDEDGINAFAAGWGIHDAAVAVTRGTLETLNRDELQGVVAHEFSHILNGDMRLNVRLMGILFGILLLAVVGRGFLRSSMFRGGRSRDRNGGSAIAIGLALLAVGYIGVFFGKLIKAAVSRQREYLADAAAVQFTRNPRGIGGALQKIGEHSRKGKIRDHHAEELSHLFFANGLGSSLASMLATHPPLEERIRRVDAAVLEEPTRPDGRTRGSSATAGAKAGKGAPGTASGGGESGAGPAGPFGGLVGVAAAAALMESVGDPRPEHVQYARELLSRIPTPLREASHDPEGARVLLLALLGGDNDETRTARRTAAGPGLADRLEELSAQVPSLEEAARLPLVDMALPSIEHLDEEEAARFRAGAEAVVRADGEMRIFDFALLHILWRHLPGESEGSRRGTVKGIRNVRAELGVLLSALAHAGASGQEEAEAAFATGLEVLGEDGASLRLLPAQSASLPEVDGALDRLERGTLELRRSVLESGAAVVFHNPQLTTAEVELLRAVGESLELPLPPLMVRTDSGGGGRA